MTAPKRPRKRQLVPEFRQDAIIEYYLSHPRATPKEVAAHFGVSQTWVHAVSNSDLFKIRLSEARKSNREHVVPTMNEQLHGAIQTAVDRLAEIVETARDPATICEVLTTLTKVNDTLKIPSFRSSEQPGAVTQNNVFVASPEAIMAARETLERLRQPAPAIEGTVESKE